MGIIAQDVERVFPELVITDRLGRKKVNYLGLVAPLIEAVKELDDRVQALEARIDERDPPAVPTAPDASAG
jgi:hypothetical protein